MPTSRIIRRRSGRGQSAMELVAARLIVPDEAARYAERIERLGQAMFGELWQVEKDAAQNPTRNRTDYEPD